MLRYPAARRGVSQLRRSASLGGAALVLLGAHVASAQTVITGIVTDSVTGRRLRDAVVLLVAEDSLSTSRGQVAVTDTTGAYRIHGVPAGTYVIAMSHARLDELGLRHIARRLRLDHAVPELRLDFAIPSARAIVTAICGARSDSTGLLVGRVLDAENPTLVDSAEVAVSWVDFWIGGRGVERRPRVMRARVDDERRFFVCGLPGDTPLSVQAVARGAASGMVELEVPPFGLTQRVLFVSSTSVAAFAGDSATPPRRRGRARATGQVRRADGRPIARAQVLMSEAGASVLTNEQGAYALDSLPAGTFSLEVRALGFQPMRRAIDLRRDSTARLDVTLVAHVPTLDVVTVYGKSRARRSLTGFLERARGGFGHFITAADIERHHASQLTDVLRMTPGIRVVPGGPGGHTLVSSRGATSFSGACRPAVFVDGMYLADGASSLNQLVQPMDVAGIEVYASSAEAPVEYNRGPCGSVVVWTKTALR